MCAPLTRELIVTGKTAFLTVNTRVPQVYPDTGHPQFCQELGRLVDERHERLPTAGHPDQGNSRGWGLGLQTTLRGGGRRAEAPAWGPLGPRGAVKGGGSCPSAPRELEDRWAPEKGGCCCVS